MQLMTYRVYGDLWCNVDLLFTFPSPEYITIFVDKTQKVIHAIHLWLQVIHTAVRLITGIRWIDHIMPTLCNMLTLAASVSVHYFQNCAAMTYRYDSIHHWSPSCFCDVFVHCVSITFHFWLCSADCKDMFMPHTWTVHFSPRNHHIVAPHIWNTLLSHLKDISISCEQFQSGVKLRLGCLCRPTCNLGRAKQFWIRLIWWYGVVIIS